MRLPVPSNDVGMRVRQVRLRTKLYLAGCTFGSVHNPHMPLPPLRKPKLSYVVINGIQTYRDVIISYSLNL